MKSPMNGFVLHVNNYLENQFSTRKTPSIAAKLYFSSRAYCKLKHRSQRHASLRDFPNVTCSCYIILKLRNYMAL